MVLLLRAGVGCNPGPATLIINLSGVRQGAAGPDINQTLSKQPNQNAAGKQS
jgi:hypothetical protein